MSDQRLRSLLHEVGLEGDLLWSTTKTGFFADGRFYYLSTIWDFLRFPPIGLFDKIRLALTIVRASVIRNWRPLEQETALQWLTRWSGPQVVARLWRPLLRAKLGENDGLVSASFIWAIIARMYGARKAETKKEMFGYVKGGYSVLLKSFERNLRELGGVLFADTPIQKVLSGAEGMGVTVEAASGEIGQFDAAVLTLPCPLIPKVCPDLTNAEKDRHDSVVYQGMICASLLTRKPLSECYITNLADERLPFTAVIEMTALVDRSHFGGQSLIYLPLYLKQEDPTWNEPDAVIKERFLDALTRVHPNFGHHDVTAFKISRARHVLALSTLNYSRDVMPDWKTSIPGVYVANSAQIANGTLNVNETLGVAERTLPRILEDLSHIRRRGNE